MPPNCFSNYQFQFIFLTYTSICICFSQVDFCANVSFKFVGFFIPFLKLFVVHHSLVGKLLTCNIFFQCSCSCMVEVKFKFLQNISNYYNNIFAFHMHVFTIFVLSFSKLNATIHSNIKFMVIAYNQNLHFRIHCKNSRNNITIHFIIILHYKKFTQRNEYKIHCRSLCFSELLKT
jgi:hypothetical protein